MQADPGVSPILALVPAIVRDQPLLDWFDDAFSRLAEAMVVPVALFGGGLPTQLLGASGGDVRLDALRAILVGLAKQGESADSVWRVVVTLARGPGDVARLWRLISVGLSLDRLRGLARRLKRPTADERFEVHADLAEGFVAFLERIDLARPRVAARLADAARRHARKQQHSRLGKPGQPQVGFTMRPVGVPGGAPASLCEALDDIAADFAANGRRLDPAGLELIARTVLDGEQLTDAAAGLGIGVAAAYKRRQRAEAAIAAFYGITSRRPATGRQRPPNPEGTTLRPAAGPEIAHTG